MCLQITSISKVITRFCTILYNFMQALKIMYIHLAMMVDRIPSRKLIIKVQG